MIFPRKNPLTHYFEKLQNKKAVPITFETASEHYQLQAKRDYKLACEASGLRAKRDYFHHKEQQESTTHTKNYQLRIPYLRARLVNPNLLG